MQRGKKFFFVRTHIDNEVANNKKAYPSTHNKAQLIADIRHKTEAQLKQCYGCQKVPDAKMTLFLIDNYEPTQYDFPDLREQLIDNFPELKREALLFTLRSATRSMVDKKVECLRSRIWKAAALSATVGLVPIPGTSLVADIAILIRETMFYCQQLGLDNESLRRLSQETGVEFSKLESLGVNIMQLQANINFFKHLTSLGVVMSVFKAESTMEQLVALVPVIGTIMAAAMSSVTTYWMLGEILDKLHGVAKKVVEVATGQLM